MDQKTLVLLQRPGSPFENLVSQFVSAEAGCQIIALTGPPLPAQAFHPQALVLWDLHGFAQPVIEQTAAELRAGSAGMVLLCPAWEESWRPLLRGAQVLELLDAPQSREELAGSLNAAWSLRDHILQLRIQCCRLSRQLKDRCIIEEAKKALMQYKNINEAEAFRLMRLHSRRTNQKLVLVAQNLLAGYKLLAPQINFYSEN